MISHGSAAVLHGLPVLADRRAPGSRDPGPELRRQEAQPRRRTRCAAAAGAVTVSGGVLVTSLARTVLDLGRTLPSSRLLPPATGPSRSDPPRPSSARPRQRWTLARDPAGASRHAFSMHAARASASRSAAHGFGTTAAAPDTAAGDPRLTRQSSWPAATSAGRSTRPSESSTEGSSTGDCCLPGQAAEEVVFAEKCREDAAARPRLAGRTVAVGRPVPAGRDCGSASSGPSPEPDDPPRPSPISTSHPLRLVRTAVVGAKCARTVRVASDHHLAGGGRDRAGAAWWNRTGTRPPRPRRRDPRRWPRRSATGRGRRRRRRRRPPRRWRSCRPARRCRARRARRRAGRRPCPVSGPAKPMASSTSSAGISCSVPVDGHQLAALEPHLGHDQRGDVARRRRRGTPRSTPSRPARRPPRGRRRPGRSSGTSARAGSPAARPAASAGSPAG